MQQRANEQAISGLQDSVNSFQSVETLVDTNKRLAEENDALQAQVEELERQIAQLELDERNLRSMVDGVSAQKDGLRQAMDWFWQINEAYVQGKYTLCKSLIKNMEDTASGSALKEYLPRESLTGNQRFSPYDRYQEIYDRLF